MDARRVDGRPIRPHIGSDGRTGSAEAHDVGIARQVEEQVVVEVARRLVQVDADARVVGEIGDGQVAGHVVRVLTDIREGEDVPDVLRVGLRVDHVDLNPRDAGPRVDHGQAPHGIIVPVPEIPGEEIVPVGLVVVRPDVEFLRLGTALHLDLLPLALLLAEDGGVVHLAPLGLELQTEQGLAALDQCALERHVDVARLDVLQDVVLLALEPDVHLVLEVERGLGVVVRSEVDLLSDAAIDGQLDPLVEVEGGDGPVPFGQTRIFRLAVAQAEVELRRTLRPDFNLVGTEDGFEDLRVDRQFRGKASLLLVQLVLHLIPELAEVFVDVVLEELIEREVGRVPEIEGVPQALADHILARRLVVVHPVLDDVGKTEAHATWRFRGIRDIRAVGQRQVHVHRIRCLILGLNRRGRHPRARQKQGQAGPQEADRGGAESGQRTHGQ